jgi:hypothetical protein
MTTTNLPTKHGLCLSFQVIASPKAFLLSKFRKELEHPLLLVAISEGLMAQLEEATTKILESKKIAEDKRRKKSQP